MNIDVSTENCSQNKHYSIESLANSKIIVKLSFEKIVSTQSRNERKRDLVQLIQSELQKFKWLIIGSVNIELLWYLNSIERQETDKVGDIDNITKPILDSLTGTNGVLIDDAQIGSIHTFWASRNSLVEDNILYIEISFNNDECMEKENLVFIQYDEAICMPFNINFSVKKDIFGTLVIIKHRQNLRNIAKSLKAPKDDLDRYFIESTWDFHRTRLGGIDNNSIYKLKNFKETCVNNGFTYSVLLKLCRSINYKSITRHLKQGLT